jgi:hypothetical protein
LRCGSLGTICIGLLHVQGGRLVSHFSRILDVVVALAFLTHPFLSPGWCLAITVDYSILPCSTISNASLPSPDMFTL